MSQHMVAARNFKIGSCIAILVGWCRMYPEFGAFGSPGWIGFSCEQTLLILRLTLHRSVLNHGTCLEQIFIQALFLGSSSGI